MNVVIAIDSFKGSLSTLQSGEAVTRALKKVYPDATATVCPLADGGEGTVDALVAAKGGELKKIEVTGPIGAPVCAIYGIDRQNATAIMEMSAAGGITLLRDEERNPLCTTTYGVGEMILDAIGEGCRRFIIGIGGSATNDGGVGMLQALGFTFCDSTGAPIARGARGLADLAAIGTGSAHKALAGCEFYVACDVKNPLCGQNGCSAVYGPQKGATPDMVAKMDAWLTHYAALTKAALPHADDTTPGAGAAGGIGFAFLAYLGATLRPGIELVIEYTGLEERIRHADLVITGEGRLDGQSCMGKAPVGVARAAKRHAKPVIAFSGCVAEDAALCNAHGIDAFFPILRTPCTLQEAMDIDNAARNLESTAEQALRLVKYFRK